MKEYFISLGSWKHVCEEVSTLLNHGYQLTGDLVVLSHRDEQGDYVAYYQPLAGERIEVEDRPIHDNAEVIALRAAAESARAWIRRVSNQYVLGTDDPHKVLAELESALNPKG